MTGFLKQLNRRTFVSRQIGPVTVLSLFSCISDYTASIVSTIIVGGAFSETGLVVTGITAPIVTFCLFICDMFFGSAVYLRNVSIAEGKKDKADRYLGNTLVFATAFGIILEIAMFFGAEFYVSFFNLSQETHDFAIQYVKASALHPLLYFWTYFGCELIFRLEKKGFMATAILCQSLGTAVLGLILIKPFGMIGMAYAIVLSDFLSALTAIIAVVLNRKSVAFKFGFIKEEVKEQLEYGFAYSQDTVYYPIYSAIIYMVIGRWFGESCMAVFAIIECVSELASLFYGISYAAENYMSIYVGEHNYDGIKKTATAAMKLQFLIAGISMVLFLIFAEPIASYMGMEDAYHTETILAIKLYAIGFIPLSYMCYFGDYFCDFEKYDSCVAIYLGKTMFAGIGITLLLGFAFGSIGIYIGKAVEPIIGLLTVYLYNRIRYKNKNFLFIEDTHNIVSYDYTISTDEIMSIRDALAEELKARSINQDTISKVMLAFEEVSMLTMEYNTHKVHAECTLIFNENDFTMIIRDAGKFLDITDTDMYVQSLRSYLVSTMVQKYINVRHISASNINRLTFSFPNE